MVDGCVFGFVLVCPACASIGARFVVKCALISNLEHAFKHSIVRSEIIAREEEALSNPMRAAHVHTLKTSALLLDHEINFTQFVEHRFLYIRSGCGYICYV